MTRGQYLALKWAVARARELLRKFKQAPIYRHKLWKAKLAVQRLDSETRVAKLVKIITGD